MFRHLFGVGLLLVVLVLAGVPTDMDTQAQEPRDDIFITFTGVDPTSNCNQIRMHYVRNRTDGLIFVGTGFYGGQRFHDDVVHIVGDSYGVATWSYFYSNDRGTVPGIVYPMTPGIPIDVFLTIYTADWQPLYEARARVKSCDQLVMLRASSGPAYQLMQNHSFELAGFDDDHVFNASKAAFWKGVNTINDNRVCNTLRGGSSAYVGLCGLLFTADSGVSKFKQTYSGVIGAPGDGVYLLAHSQSYTGYLGKGKVIARLTMTNGLVMTLKTSFPSGTTAFGFPYEAFAKLPAPIQSAVVTIKQGAGAGGISVDAVTLSVFTNTNAMPRALPLPGA